MIPPEKRREAAWLRGLAGDWRSGDVSCLEARRFLRSTCRARADRRPGAEPRRRAKTFRSSNLELVGSTHQQEGERRSMYRFSRARRDRCVVGDVVPAECAHFRPQDGEMFFAPGEEVCDGRVGGEAGFVDGRRETARAGAAATPFRDRGNQRARRCVLDVAREEGLSRVEGRGPQPPFEVGLRRQKQTHARCGRVISPTWRDRPHALESSSTERIPERRAGVADDQRLEEHGLFRESNLWPIQL